LRFGDEKMAVQYGMPDDVYQVPEPFAHPIELWKSVSILKASTKNI
jgi:hypothetical protein